MIPECTDLRIGATAATLHYLRHRGILEPDEWTFRPYSVTRIDGNGQQKGYGYPVASWAWETLGQDTLDKFFDLFAAATDAGVQVYISTYTDTGPRQATTDYTAYMRRPVDGEGKAMYPGTLGVVYRNVTISFTHLEAV